MTNQNLIDAAKAAVGEATRDDELIDPQGHAEIFKDDAPSLAQRLNRSEVRAAADQHRLSNQHAIKKQAEFKRYSTLAGWMIVAAAAASAAIMVVGNFFPGDLTHLQRGVSVALAVVGLAAGSAAGACLAIIKGGRHLEQWMTE